MASVLALDFGASRVGVAVSVVGFAQPRAALANDVKLLANIAKLLGETGANRIVVGLPRNLNGDDTPQTINTRAFAKKLEESLRVPVYLIDEAATSVQAEAELAASKKAYERGDIDSLAAVIILEDFLANNEEQ